MSAPTLSPILHFSGDYIVAFRTLQNHLREKNGDIDTVIVREKLLFSFTPTRSVLSNPVAYGFLSGVWTSPMITRVIQEEFDITYHPGHVRKLLYQLVFSVQRPKRLLAKADKEKQDRWYRYTYPAIKKNRQEGAALIHEDEVSFRQDSTLHATWSRKGHQPLITVTGARKSIKIFGSIELRSARFLYQRAKVFNFETYINYLERLARCYYPRRVYYIQDNASYHKKKEVWAWFKENRSWWTVYNLPPYSPEFNAAEPIWHHVRMKGTHNRYFDDEHELLSTLTRVFRSIQRNPDQIVGYLKPFL